MFTKHCSDRNIKNLQMILSRLATPQVAQRTKWTDYSGSFTSVVLHLINQPNHMLLELTVFNLS